MCDSQSNKSERQDVILRFKNVEDMEILLIDIELMLESLGEEGWILDWDTELE